MNTWANIEWHYEIHRRFGEQLVYYLLRVRPFVVPEIKSRLKSLLEREELESIRVFEIFGRNDLLIRAWLHPNFSNEFPSWLRDSLQYDTEVDIFVVTDPHVISSSSPKLLEPEND